MSTSPTQGTQSATSRRSLAAAVRAAAVRAAARHGGHGGPPGSAIPPHLHGSLQQFADVHRVAINVRGDPRGGLRVEVQWAATRNVPSPREMNSTERQALNKILVDMNIGVIPSGDVTNAPAVIVRIEPQPETAATQPPSQHGTGQDLRIDEVPSRVGQPGYEELAPQATDIPGRAGLNEVEQRALDRYVGRMRRRRQMTEHLEGELRAASTDELRRRLQQAINEQPRVDEERRRAEQVRGSNAPDPRQAQFDHERDEGGGVTSRWNGNEPPSKREINQATEVAEATGEPVVLYGNNFSGIDGTIGANPPRLLQLKSAQDGPTLIRVLTEARQNAQRHGDRGLDVHVLARELSLAQASDELRRTPVAFGSWLGRVTIHVRGGHFEAPPRAGCRRATGDGITNALFMRTAMWLSAPGVRAIPPEEPPKDWRGYGATHPPAQPADVADMPGDLLDRHAVVGQQRVKRMPQVRRTWT